MKERAKIVKKLKAQICIYRKYQVFHKILRCKNNIPETVNVFNNIGSNSNNRYQYLGKYYVTDYFIDDYSDSKFNSTKIAVVFELTPVVNRKSSLIDENYIFE